MLLSLLLAILILTLYGSRLATGGFHADYLDRGKTDSIKGIFILLIVLAHSMQYVKGCCYSPVRFGDTAFKWFLHELSQLVVVMFLFYSGYGVGESFKKKGAAYVKKIPRHRILATLVNFDIAVGVFIIINLLLGVPITLRQSLLSFTGWEDVGNSNWYIFVILVCYTLTYMVLSVARTKLARVTLLFASCLPVMLVLYYTRGSWWYDTMLCYPAGFAFSMYRRQAESLFKKRYWIALCACVVAFFVLRAIQPDNYRLAYNLMSISFALIVVLTTMKLGIDNPLLRWAGSNLFPIYIYMRVPMLIIEQTHPELIAAQPFLFILISLTVTIVIARCYRYWQVKM